MSKGPEAGRGRLAQGPGQGGRAQTQWGVHGFKETDDKAES